MARTKVRVAIPGPSLECLPGMYEAAMVGFFDSEEVMGADGP